MAVPLERGAGGTSGRCWAARRVEQVWERVGGALIRGGMGAGLGGEPGMELTEPGSLERQGRRQPAEGSE